jgi:hypothetical protein
MSLIFVLTLKIIIMKKKFENKYQDLEKKTFINYENNFNSYQDYLYKRALYGLKSIKDDELSNMCTAKQKRIKTVHYRAQQVLNVYKHKVTKKLTDDLLEVLFPKSILAKSLKNYNEIDAQEFNKLSFKDLGINKEDIVKVFVEEGVLPRNFYNLSPQDNPKFLPSLKVKS